MEIRPAEPEDRARIATLAENSFRSSYALSPQQIETLVENEFDPETLADRIEDPDAALLVAEHAVGDAEQVQGFVDVTAGEERTIRWLHVDPAARILEDAVEGGEFLEGFGLESDDTDHMSVGGEEFAVAVFTGGEGSDDPNEPAVAVPGSVPVDGAERPLDRDERIPGRDAPFFRTYAGEDRADPYGYFCSNCGSTDVAADGLDRLECGECGNVHRAEEWDASYL
ncbi:GNAT family N-acetyltransferase [Halobacteriales archaeon QH_6_68_27]|nr:MAG: GNAT family N-acetyltransferase [Halobacteriales archaeon QH_6_68_27]